MENMVGHADPYIHPAFWRDRKVLITGHTGFKGSWLSLWLLSMGACVSGYALPPATNPSLFQLAGIGNEMEHMTGDVRNLADLEKSLQSAAPEIVFHMAAQPIVRESYLHPVETYETNVMGTVNVLEAVRHRPSVRAVVVVTTDKCYENKEWVWGYRESDPMGGFDPYSSSKGCAELIVSAYRNSFFSGSGKDTPHMALASARAGNVIGGGDWAVDRLIPDILRSFSLGQPVCIRRPEAIRPWQYVLEPLCGYLRLAEDLCQDGGRFAESFNFGPRTEDVQSVGWIVRRMVELWGDGARYEIDMGDHPHEANFLKLDISKAHTFLHWSPIWDIRTALGHTVEWEKRRLSGENARDICLQQIQTYSNDLERISRL